MQSKPYRQRGVLYALIKIRGKEVNKIFKNYGELELKNYINQKFKFFAVKNKLKLSKWIRINIHLKIIIVAMDYI